MTDESRRDEREEGQRALYDLDAKVRERLQELRDAIREWDTAVEETGGGSRTWDGARAAKLTEWDAAVLKGLEDAPWKEPERAFVPVDVEGVTAARLNAAEQQGAALRGALRALWAYADHRADCREQRARRITDKPNNPCDCGFREAAENAARALSPAYWVDTEVVPVDEALGKWGDDAVRRRKESLTSQAEPTLEKEQLAGGFVRFRQREGDQPLPRAGQQNVSEAVKADLDARIQLGIQRYGQPLQTFNGRDALKDLYEELLDACHYAKQAILERDVEKAERP
jgi:hypothetical protein